MKKIVNKYQGLFLALLLLAISLIPFGNSTVSAANGGVDPEFNLFETIGEFPEEFIAETTALIADNWDENYFSSITIELGETIMYVDGSEVLLSNPVIMESGEIMLPIIDIANVVGAEVEVDETTGEITILNDGEATIIEQPMYDDYVHVSANMGNTAGFGYEAAVVPIHGEPITKELPLLSSEEVERVLGLDIHSDGDRITISKPYQLKQIILYITDEKGLKDSYGADQVISSDQGLYFLQYPTEKLTQNAYETFKADPRIAYVTVNHVVRTADLSKRWGSERIAVDRFKSYLVENNKATTPLSVAVLDTGIDVSHPHLYFRTVGGYNFIKDDYNNDPNNPFDKYGHGTHVSGTIVDCTTPNVKIMPVKVLNDSGFGDEYTISLGIRYAADNSAKVINMSLGGVCNDDDCLVKQAVDDATAAGVIIVVAAGNDSSDTKDVCPAKLANVITVAALYDNDLPTYFTNYGDAIDVAAPGYNILSSIPGGEYKELSGTSMASPHVAAAAAMLALEYPKFSPQEIKTAIGNTVVDLGEPGWDRIYGAGVLDFRIFFGDYVLATGLSITNNTLEIKLGQSHKLDAIVSPMNATNKSVIYTSSDDSIIVYQSGAIVGKGLGSAVITATIANGTQRTCQVTVNPSNDWIDYAADAYAGGNGKEEHPYLIATAEQLAKLAKDVGDGEFFRDKYFKLIADIDLSGKLWTPIYYYRISGSGGYSEGFQGVFDGDGYAVYNMEVSISSDSPGYPAGLFGRLGKDMWGHVDLVSNKTEIKNLAVLNASVSVSSNNGAGTGILCGQAIGGVTISNCYTSGSIISTPLYPGGIGGLVGWLGVESTIRNCYSTANTGEGAGGLVGTNGGGYIYNSYSSGNAVDVGFAFEQNRGNPGGTNTATVNSFSAVTATSGNGFMDTKESGVVRNCYYLSTNSHGIENDSDVSSTNLRPKPLTDFKDINFYKTYANWDSDYPWNYDNVWGIDENINNGLPFLRIFMGYEDAESPVIITQPTDLTVDAYGTATLLIKASVSKGMLSYQWYENTVKTNKGGTAINGATGAAFNVPTTEAGTKYYYCVVINTDNSVKDNKIIPLDSKAVSVSVNGYIISFDANGGSGIMADQIFAPRVPQALNANTFTRSGYTFKGWAQNPTDDAKYDDRLVIVSFSDLTFYAVWDDYGNTFNDAFSWTLTAGTTNSRGGTIDYSNDADMYKFTALSTGTHTFFTSNTASAEIYLVLYDSSQSYLNSNIVGGNAIVSFQQDLTAGQVYYLKAYASPNETGAYSININAPPAPGTTTYTGRIKSHIPSLEANVVLFDSSGKTEICSAKTNKDGAYTLTVPASAPAGEKYILKVTKPGYLPCTVTNVTLNKGEGLKTIDISPFGGDLNGDGYITMDEVLLLMQLAVDEYYSYDHNIYPYVDVYKDEYGIPRVTMADVLSASRASVGALEDIDYEKIK